MKEIVTIFAPQWWSFKNRLLRSGSGSYARAFFIVLLAAGFWAAVLGYMPELLGRLQGMEGDVGNIIALKSLSLVLMLVFFMLVFSSLLSCISIFYLSNDLHIVLSSPVSWDSIYYSKWTETVIKSSWMIAFAVLPFFIAFGISYHSPAIYYAYLLPVLLMFTLIPAGIGIVLGICLMAAVPANRARNIFMVLGLLILAIIFLLFRFLRPERFANPEWFANMTIFLSEMKMPVSVFLPSMWATETLTPFFSSQSGIPYFYLLLLLFTTCAFVVFGNWSFHAFFYNGYIKAQQGRRPWLATSGQTRAGFIRIFSPQNMYASVLRAVRVFVKGRAGAFIEKDLVTFSRSVGQSSQLLLLLAVMIIYLFSIRALPLEWGTFLSLKLRYIVSFLNIGLVGFVIAAVAARLVLPTVENEGRAFWVIRVSPVSMRTFLWSKFITAFFPLLILAQVLIVISNMFLGVKVWFMVLGIGTCAVMTASITGLAVGISARTARFSLIDSDREQTGLKGAVYMLSAVAAIVMTILLEIIPTLSMFLKEVSGSSLTFRGWATMGILFFAVFVLNGLIIWTAMRMGEKRLASLE